MTGSAKQIIEIIARPTEERKEVDIDFIIPWLRSKVPILGNIDTGDLVEVVKFCECQTVSSDEVIIRQRDKGDRMFIILRGSALVYIDTSLTGEEESPLVSTTASPQHKQLSLPEVKPRDKRTDRASLGKYITKYGVGKHFGQVALLSKDNTRNATIVADEDCTLMVIGQKLFDKTLKSEQECEYAEICHFVEKHPVFAHMTPKLKRILEISLRRETYPFGWTIVKQGAAVTCLQFLLRGQADMFVEPNAYQKQYPNLWPFETGTDLCALEFEWLRNSRKSAILRKYEGPGALPIKSEQVMVRRTQGYAAAERLMQERRVCLCSVHDGEVIGDLEVVQNLGTYLSTVVCTATTTAFVLDVRNLERLVGRKNPVTMEVMRQMAKEKHERRASSLLGKDISFLKYLLVRFDEEHLTAAEEKKLTTLKMSKHLPGRDVQIQHMLEKFKDGQAELIEPRVPGALIYKQQMKERAKIRGRGAYGVSAKVRETQRMAANRQPRSRREIIKALTESLETELVEYTRGYLAKHGGNLSHLRKAKREAFGTDGAEVNENKMKRDNQTNARFQEHLQIDLTGDEDRIKYEDGGVSTERNINHDSKTENSINDNGGALSGECSLPLATNSSAAAGEAEAPSFEQSILVINQVNNNETEGQGHNCEVAPSVQHTPDLVTNFSVRSSDNREEHPDSSFLPSSNNRPEEPPDSNFSGDDGKEFPVTSFSPNSSHHREQLQSVSTSFTKLPPVCKMVTSQTDDTRQTKWNSPITLVKSKIRDRFLEPLLSHSTNFEDYETSDNNLRVLENRIKTFFASNAKSRNRSDLSDLIVEKLRRYNVDLVEPGLAQPKPGGRVWVHKTLCRFHNSSAKINDHQHVRYHIVPELPQFKDVERARFIVQHLLSGATARNTSPRQL